MSLDPHFPAISDLKARARRRIPHFVWEYLDSATGREATLARNRSALDEILFDPAVLQGEFTPDLSTTFLGCPYPAPFGIAPVGMSGLMWPDAEGLLARTAAKTAMPYAMSTVASQTPEDVAPHLGENAWFQLYPPRDKEIRLDMLKRAKDAGFETLILTLDVPGPSRRERQTRGGLVQPPRLTPKIFAQAALCPQWSLGILRRGMPRLKLIEQYAESTSRLPSTAHIGYLMRTSPDLGYLRQIRQEWDGPLLVKGILRPEDAALVAQEGVDGIWVSNHAGRQFDAAPATIEVLPSIRAATDLPIVFDSGVEGGLDIMRALALGADFVMLGRAWHYGLGAKGAAGAAHVHHILTSDMSLNMVQIGARTLKDLPKSLRKTF